MPIYHWKDYEKQAKSRVDNNRPKSLHAKTRLPVFKVSMLPEIGNQFDQLASYVDIGLDLGHSKPRFSQDTYKHLFELGEFVQKYKSAVDGPPVNMVDIENGRKTRLELFAKYLGFAFELEMWKRADMETVAVWCVEVDERIKKGKDLSRLELILGDSECSARKVGTVNSIAESLSEEHDWDSGHYERYAKAMRSAKVGTYVIMDQKDLPSLDIEAVEDWAEEYMHKWFRYSQEHSRTLLNLDRDIAKKELKKQKAVDDG